MKSGTVLSALSLIVMGVLAVAAYSYLGSPTQSSKHPLLDQIRERFKRIDPKYGNIPLRTGNSAYTENKEVITLCLVNPETKQDYDINTLMYVALHELAHVISKSTGHGPEFKDNFAKLLKKASDLQIYNPRKPIPANYCNVKAA